MEAFKVDRIAGQDIYAIKPQLKESIKIVFLGPQAEVFECVHSQSIAVDARKDIASPLTERENGIWPFVTSRFLITAELFVSTHEITVIGLVATGQADNPIPWPESPVPYLEEARAQERG